MKVYAKRCESDFGWEVVMVRTRQWSARDYCPGHFRSVTNLSLSQLPYNKEVVLDVREDSRNPDFWALRNGMWIEFHREQPCLHYVEERDCWTCGKMEPTFIASATVANMRYVLGEFEDYECAPFRVRVVGEKR